MDKAGAYVGCLGFVGLIGLLTGFLTKFMTWMPALLLSCLILSVVFVYWFGRCYERRLQNRRSRCLDDFDPDE